MTALLIRTEQINAVLINKTPSILANQFLIGYCTPTLIPCQILTEEKIKLIVLSYVKSFSVLILGKVDRSSIF